MRLTLSTDDGEVLEVWNIDDEQVNTYWGGVVGLRRIVEISLPVLDDEGE